MTTGEWIAVIAAGIAFAGASVSVFIAIAAWRQAKYAKTIAVAARDEADAVKRQADAVEKQVEVMREQVDVAREAIEENKARDSRTREESARSVLARMRGPLEHMLRKSTTGHTFLVAWNSPRKHYVTIEGYGGRLHVEQREVASAKPDDAAADASWTIELRESAEPLEREALHLFADEHPNVKLTDPRSSMED